MTKFNTEKLLEKYPDAAKHLFELQEALKAKELQRKGQENFITYIKHMWPEFIEGEHHKIFAEKLEQVARGELKRLIINMPPRHTKSEFASYLFPAWLMGQKPKTKIIQATHTAELSYRFGRKMRNSKELNNIFRIPHLKPRKPNP